MTLPPKYAFAERALRRWRDERLQLTTQPDGGVVAVFRFEGSTCSNIPFALIYTVQLASATDERRVLAMSCVPEAGAEGHQRMCSFQEDAERMLRVLQTEGPLIGRALHEVLAWTPAVSPAGCVCAAASRNHKWLAVLHTVHYALNAA